MKNHFVDNIGRVTYQEKIKRLLKKLTPTDILWKYRKLIQKPGSSGLLQNNVYLQDYEIGTYSQGSLIVNNASKGFLKIGKFCSFARGSTINLGGEHPTNWVCLYHSFYSIDDDFKKLRTDTSHSKGDVVIGNDVWLGSNAVIMSGVTIGDGAVIGAHSIVRRDIPAYGIAMGNPARPVSFRFNKEQVEELLKIAWWEWPTGKIKEAYPLLLSPNIDEFIKKYQVSKF